MHYHYIQYNVDYSFHAEAALKMDIFISFLIIMDIMILLIPNIVSTAFALFTVTDMGTYDITTPNWIEILVSLKPLSNRYAIIFAINVLIFNVFTLILQTTTKRAAVHWFEF